MKRIYLDYAATTPLDPRVKNVMDAYETEKFGNASSIHAFGFDALAAVDVAKDALAKFLNCLPSEIIFTSGATESNNLAIQGVVLAAHHNLKPDSSMVRKHLVTSAFEHPSVLETFRFLEKQGFDVTYLSVGKDGVIDPEEVKKVVTDRTLLISVMYVNNEIGTIQPITKIGRIAKKVGAVFHVDAVQAVNYLDCDVDRLKADFITLSSHKVYGPKGVGALYVRKGTALNPLTYGGEQEYGLRPGTYNVAAIAGFGEAIKLAQADMRQEQGRVAQLKDELIGDLGARLPHARINGSMQLRIANNLHITVPGVDGESLILKLDLAGYAVSMGSACSAGSIEPSHVLQAIGCPDQDIKSSIRVTLGRETTVEDVKGFVETLEKLCK